MNIYTLQYQDQDLELKYQQQENSNSRFTLFKAVSYAAIMILTLRIVISYVNSKPTTNVIPEIVALALNILILILVKRNPQHSWIALIQLNVCMMLFQIFVEPTQHPQTTYMMGSNLMIGHCIIIFVSDFRCSVVQVFLLCGIRIGILCYKVEYFATFYFFLTITCGILYLVVLYQIDKIKRLQYIQGLKENQWDDVITKILVKPFVIFKFDNPKFTFRHKLSADCKFCNTTETLVHFLRQSQYRKMTLEQYLFGLQEKKLMQNQFTRTLLIQNEKKTLKIRLSSFYLTERLFLIVFDDDAKNIKKIKEECYQNYLINQKIFLNLIIKTYKKISKAVRDRDLAQIAKVQLHQMIIYLKTKNSNIRNDQISIKKIRIFKVLQMINKLINFRAHFRNNDRFLKFSTITHQFILCLLEIFQVFDTNEYQIAYHQSLNKELIFQISGDRFINNNDIIQNNFPSIIHLVEKHYSNDTCRVLLVFNKYPLVSYL